MRLLRTPARVALVCAVLLVTTTAPALAKNHLWRVKEVFSNPDGTIQFIELAACCGSSNEFFLEGQIVSSDATGNSFVIPSDVEPPTLNKHYLLATSGFAALPGAPTPDRTIVNGFFSIDGDTIRYAVNDLFTFGVGFPTDGVTSLNKDPDDITDTTFPATNSPTNYADVTGSVTVPSGPPAVPDGGGGTTPMTVEALVPDGSDLLVSFDVGSCTNAADHHIVFGQGSGFPAVPADVFTLLGTLCDIGNLPPFTWVGVPEATDGTNLLWFLVVTTGTGGLEGSWGLGGGTERVGPGLNGSSGICATDKSVSNSCGNTPP